MATATCIGGCEWSCYAAASRLILAACRDVVYCAPARPEESAQPARSADALIHALCLPGERRAALEDVAAALGCCRVRWSPARRVDVVVLV